LEKQLQATQKALEPGPKAKLVFTFDKPDLYFSVAPLREISVKPENGVVTINFTAFNRTNVEAEDIELTLHICDDCKFEKEPEGSQQQNKGAPENQRVFRIPRMHGRTVLPVMNAQIRPPGDAGAFQVGVSYRCKTCDIPDVRDNLGTVNIIRSIPLKFFKPAPLKVPGTAN
jgi:hypothetical protein